MMEYSLSLQERLNLIVENGCCGSEEGGEPEDMGSSAEGEYEGGEGSEMLTKALKKLKKRKK